MIRLSKFVVVALAGLVGCASEGAIEEDGRDDSFTSDGKLDGFQCTPAEAAAILQVVNTATLTTLKTDVQLADKAADNIVAVRAGDDEVASTADDVEFGTLAQLDAVPYIGPTAFQRLLAYVHDADLVGDPPAPVGEWTFSTVANGESADYAIAPDGRFVLTYETATGYQLRLADGTVVALPSDVATYYRSRVQVAVDETGAPHVIYRKAASPTTYENIHLVHRNGQLVAQPSIIAADVWLDQSPDGKVFALVRKNTCTNCTAPLEMHSLSGTAVVEPLWTVSPTNKIGFSVGIDGFPAFAAGGGHVRYSRRSASGWRTIDVGPIQANELATTGGASATVIGGYSGITVHRQNGGTFDQLDQQRGSYIDAIDATTDGVGTAHACLTEDGNVFHVQVDTTGAVTRTGQGVAEECWIGTDVDGKLHMFTRQGNVINHGTFE